MAREPAARSGKTESLTIRLDPKTRFVLDYISRLKGQTITTVIERAIVAAAAQESVADQSTYGAQLDWRDFWDISDGVRALRLAEYPEFFPSFEEDKRLAFCKEHWPFFWSTAQRRVFLNHYVDVLWPRIDEFIQIHDDQKARDYYAAGKAMQKALADAKLAFPTWPDDTPPPARPARGSAKDMDDEIPF